MPPKAGKCAGLDVAERIATTIRFLTFISYLPSLLNLFLKDSKGS